MKKILMLSTAALGVAFVVLAFEKSASIHEEKKLRSFKTVNAIGCSPDWNSLEEWMNELEIPPMPGSGTHKWKISTSNDSAQFYFNQGMNMYYSFHIIEAMASFKKAVKFDPSAGMLYWAQALAYGPNINDVGYAASPEALTAVQKAVDLCKNCSDKEKMLVAAQEARYSADSTQLREHLNQLYTDKMKLAYQKYPNDADVAALYADAMMLQHPWDLWNINGTPKPWTPGIREVLEKMLAVYPDHPGANHYYIHVMEPSPFAAKALPSADRLGKITPGLAHTVHMPSHIYLRVGDYKEGAQVNEDAVSSYKKYIELYAPVTGNDFLYIIHNLHMQTNQAMLAGRAKYAAESSDATRQSIPKDYLSLPGGTGNYMQYIYMSPVLVDVKFGNWEDLLQMETPPASMIYANVIYHFGKGMAYVKTGNIPQAKSELNSLQQLLKDSALRQPFTPFSPAIEGAIVAGDLLKGTIASAETKNEEALASFENAVEREAKMVYTEPRDWMLNPRHYLGEELLKQKNWSMAINVFNDDLKVNDANGWSLYGKHLALKNSGKKTEAAKILVKYNKAFSDSDLTAPVF